MQSTKARNLFHRNAETLRPLRMRPGIPPRLGVRDPEEGAATAEYVIATMAAVGFAGLLVVIMRGEEVRGMLTDLVRNALTLVS